MTEAAKNLDLFLYAALPYIALALFFVLSIRRYTLREFTVSSLSSQLLENQQHFWGLAPFHYGIIVVLTGHIVAFLFPREVLLFNKAPVRLYILEVSALLFGLLAVIGLGSLILRRAVDDKIRVTTSTMDWLVLFLLAAQIVGGVAMAVFHPWGSSWFAAAMTPYLRSIFWLQPDISYVTTLPFLVKLHVVNAWLLIGLFPFTRLMHILVVPVPYLWRRTQVARWHGIKRFRPGAGGK